MVTKNFNYKLLCNDYKIKYSKSVSSKCCKFLWVISLIGTLNLAYLPYNNINVYVTVFLFLLFVKLMHIGLNIVYSPMYLLI